jgi:hypothetical protein
MKKKYLLVPVVIILVLVTVYFLNQSTQFIPSVNSEAQNGENKSSTPFNLPFRFPWQQPAETPENTSNGSGSSGSSSGSSKGSSVSTNQTKNVPTIKYTLNVNSKFSDLDFITVYYLDGVLQNNTNRPPFSINIDANTTVCVGAISSYTGTFWDVDGITYEMKSCAGYPNGCEIVMNSPHNVTFFQYS